MVPYKGADMLLEAAAPLLRHGKLALDMIGDGPMLTQLKEIAAREGIKECVTFHGWLEHNSVQELAVRSNLLLFPSVREFGGGVVLEAMALGVVPLICDYAGPTELVDDELGYKIKMGSREEIISRLRDQLVRIIADPTDLPIKSRAARARVLSRFTWEAKAGQVLQVYDWVLGRRLQRPCFD
jgi:glycosyltransferase involved in cell wall biosynthesis